MYSESGSHSSASAPLQLQVVEGNNFQNDSQLVSALRGIIEETYIDPLPILMRSLSSCDQLYLVFREKQIASFLTVSRPQSLTVGDQDFRSIYLGLGATEEKFRKTGALRYLFQQLILNFQAWEKKNQKPILLWFTTANPLALPLMHSVFPELEPKGDGRFSQAGEALAHSVCSQAGWTKLQSPEHPFVLRGLVQDARYSKKERESIARASKRLEPSLLAKLEIKERNGDRLLLITRIPKI